VPDGIRVRRQDWQAQFNMHVVRYNSRMQVVLDLVACGAQSVVIVL
jgi:hypothetical protein